MKYLYLTIAALVSLALNGQHNTLNNPKWAISLETGIQANYSILDGAVLGTPVKLTGEYFKPLKRNSSYSIGFTYGITELKFISAYNPDIRPLIPPMVYYNPGFGNMVSTFAIPVTYARHTGRFTRLELGGVLAYDLAHDGYKVGLSTENQTTIPQLFLRAGVRTFLKRRIMFGIHLSSSITPSEYFDGKSEHYFYESIPTWGGYRAELMFSLSRFF